MSKQVLTDRAVAAAKADSGRLELWDLRSHGLCLRVTDRGVKTWIYRYRAPDGRPPRFTIGKFPSIGLKDARVRGTELERDVAFGGDPAMERRAARVVVKEAPKTFDDLADAYFEACAAGEWKPKGKRKKAAVLEGERQQVQLHVRPVLGSLPFAEITRPRVKALLRGKQATSIGAQTNLTQAIIRQIYNFAISDDLVQVNPSTGFSPFADSMPRSRIWSTAKCGTCGARSTVRAVWLTRTANPSASGRECGSRSSCFFSLGKGAARLSAWSAANSTSRPEPG